MGTDAERDAEEAPGRPGLPPAKVELRAALLLILLLILLGGFLVYVLYARGTFEATQRLILLTDDSEGLSVGMDLTFSGFPIGRVRRFELAEDGKVRILVDVPRKDARWLRTSSVFTIERGLVGETRIRAFSGVLEDPPLAENAVRDVLRGDTAAELPRLIATARTLLDNLERMSATDSPLNASLGQLRTLAERAGGPYGALSGVLGSDEHAQKVIVALDHANALLAKTDQRVFGRAGVMDGTQKLVVQLNALLGELRVSMKKVDAVLADAQAIGTNARLASTDLGVLRNEVEVSLRKISQLVDEINRKWPFARETELKLP
jgi:phospholipid/cholesterol/gamma-HCH transport system substrate-binding protein